MNDLYNFLIYLMKTIFTFLILICFDIRVFSADVLPVHTYTSPYLEKMRAMHPQTYAGYMEIPVDPKAQAGLYRQGFFDFMNRIESTTPPHLWQPIYDEARNIESPTDDQITALYMRAWLLSVDGEISEAFKDLVNGDTKFLPVIQIMYKALTIFRDAYPHWKISTELCLLEERPLDPEKAEILRRIEKELLAHNIPPDIMIPMVGAGELGISTLVDMWLVQRFPLPMGISYRAHNIDLNTAEAAIHDLVHKQLDVRKEALVTLIQEKLRTLPHDLPLITRYKAERYHMVMDVLKAYRDKQQKQFLNNFKKAKGNAEKEEAARKAYDHGIAPLFIALHEANALGMNVFEADSLEGAFKDIQSEMDDVNDSDQIHAHDAFEFFVLYGENPKDSEVLEYLITHTLMKTIQDMKVSEEDNEKTVAQYIADKDLSFMGVKVMQTNTCIEALAYYRGLEETASFTFAIDRPESVLFNTRNSFDLLKLAHVDIQDLPHEGYTPQEAIDWMISVSEETKKLNKAFIDSLRGIATKHHFNQRFEALVKGEKHAFEVASRALTRTHRRSRVS